MYPHDVTVAQQWKKVTSPSETSERNKINTDINFLKGHFLNRFSTNFVVYLKAVIACSVMF